MSRLTNKAWWEAAGVRAVKTMAQTALASITVGAAVPDVNWMYAASTTVVAGVCSILTSLAGLPEVNEEE